MASYDDLTPDEQQAIDDFMSHVRPAAGVFAQSTNNAQWILSSGDANSAIELIQSLDSGTIPQKTGLADALPLTPAETLQLVADLQKVVDEFASQSDLFIKACGVNAIIRGNSQ